MASNVKDKLKQMKMPSAAPAPSVADEDELLLGMEDEVAESEETASPLADFSDEDILAEARARGLSLEQEEAAEEDSLLEAPLLEEEEDV